MKTTLIPNHILAASRLRPGQLWAILFVSTSSIDKPGRSGISGLPAKKAKVIV
jgi:hypothetical protein